MERPYSWSPVPLLVTDKSLTSQDKEELGYSILHEEPIDSHIKVEEFLHSNSGHFSFDCVNASKLNSKDDQTGLNNSSEALLKHQSTSHSRRSLPVNCSGKTIRGALFSCYGVDTHEPEYQQLQSHSGTGDSTTCCSCLPSGLIIRKTESQHQYESLLPIKDQQASQISAAKEDLFPNNCQFDTLKSRVNTQVESTKVEKTGPYYGRTRMTSSQVCGKSMLQMLPPSTDMYSRDGKQKMYQAYTGQLKIHIEATADQKSLQIRILQAHDLPFQPSSGNGSLVKVTMNGSSKKKLWQSSVISHTNHPVYNGHMSFEVKRKDYNKRLVVSVCHYNTTLRSKKVIGFMSFGVQNVVQKKTTVDGWYYLLDGHLGQQKHMRATEEHSTRTHATSTPIRGPNYCESESSGYTGSISSSSSFLTDDPSLQRIPDTNIAKPVEMHRIPIFKNQQGYGMTLHGGNPVHITKIQSGSPAATAGLQVGDQVVRINGQAVQTMYAHTLSKIICHYPRCIILDVMRSSEKEMDPVAVTTNFHLLTYMENELMDITTSSN